MGMVQNGTWIRDEDITLDGHYVRQSSVFDKRIEHDVIDAIAQEPGRFVLIGSRSCPWSHRAMLMRELKGLTDLIPLHIAHGPRVEGYAANGGESWLVPGTDYGILHLHELYTLSDPHYSGRSTVPILWDSKDQQILSNESSVIMRALDSVRSGGYGADYTFVPKNLLNDLDDLNDWIYENLSNGVYRAVFANTQDAYDAAVENVFAALGRLESILASQRYLLGSIISEADWRLFPTLLRFDAVYTIQHRCSLRRLTDYPNLWAYARELYSWQGVSSALSIGDMKLASYANEAGGIVPAAPVADWDSPHNREAFGEAQIALRNGEVITVEPREFLDQVNAA